MKYYDPKTYSDSKSLLNAICDFVTQRCTSSYLQGKNVDVITVRRNASLTIKTLRECRTDESYELIWERADQISSDIKCWTQDTNVVNFRDARVQPKKPSRVNRVNTYFNSLDQVLAELETRFQGNDQDVLCALGAVVLSEKPSESDYALVGNFYGLDKDLIPRSKTF